MSKLTQSEKLQRKNSKAIAKMRAAEKRTNELHERVRRGEISAAEAFRLKCEGGDRSRQK